MGIVGSIQGLCYCLSWPGLFIDPDPTCDRGMGRLRIPPEERGFDCLGLSHLFRLFDHTSPWGASSSHGRQGHSTRRLAEVGGDG